MANELAFRYGGTGNNLYAVIRSRAGDKVWDTTTETFVTQVVADWANYAIAMVESPAGGYLYYASFPAVTYGVYGIEVYERAGETAAIDDALRWVGQCYWSGLSIRRRWGETPVEVGG